MGGGSPTLHRCHLAPPSISVHAANVSSPQLLAHEWPCNIEIMDDAITDLPEYIVSIFILQSTPHVHRERVVSFRIAMAELEQTGEGMVLLCNQMHDWGQHCSTHGV